jgi:hypothetical protein
VSLLTLPIVGCKRSSDTYTVLERVGPDRAPLNYVNVDATLLHNGEVLHVACNNYKSGDGPNVAPCGPRVGEITHCQFFPDPMSDDAGGYDLICGTDRKYGKLTTSAKNDLLTIERDGQDYLFNSFGTICTSL